MRIDRILPAAVLSLALMQASASAWAQTDLPPPRALQLLWSTPLTLEPVPPDRIGKVHVSPREDGFLLTQSVDRAGRITVLAKRKTFSSAVDMLLDDFERDGFQKPIALQLTGDPADDAPVQKDDAVTGHLALVSMTIASDAEVWVGGATDFVTGLDSVTRSHAYVARLDRAGAVLWERQYDAGNLPFVFSMTPAAGGDVLVASHDGWNAPSWLALLAAKDGSIIWQQRFGTGKAIDAVRLGSDAYLVATIDAGGAAPDYREDVVVRRVSLAGELGAANIVRPDINRVRASDFAQIEMSPLDDGAYVLSSWPSPLGRVAALVLAKVDSAGRLVWSKAVPDGVVIDPDGGRPKVCSGPAVTTLPNGDALVACSLGAEIRTHEFDRSTGDDRQASFLLPDCNDGKHPVAISLFPRPDGQVLVSGTRPSNNVAASCSWLARLPLKAP